MKLVEHLANNSNKRDIEGALDEILPQLRQELNKKGTPLIDAVISKISEIPDFITKHFLPMIEFLNQNDAKIERLKASNLRLDAKIDELSETNSNLNLKLEEFSAKNASLLLKMTGSAILKGQFSRELIDIRTSQNLQMRSFIDSFADSTYPSIRALIFKVMED